MIAADIFRGSYRESFTRARPIKPDTPLPCQFALPTVGDLIVVLGEADIQLPMQVVLNPPVAAQRLSKLLGTRATASDEIMLLGTDLALDLPFMDAHAYRGQF